MIINATLLQLLVFNVYDILVPEIIFVTAAINVVVPTSDYCSLLLSYEQLCYLKTHTCSLS